MSDNLKQKAARGIAWKFLEQGGAQLLQFVSGIYIARILSPEDYGLVGMMAIFLGISQMFIDSGFRATLIQKGDVTHDDYNVVFIFNIAVSSLFYLLIFWGAPSISNFYNEPRLILVARVLGLNLIFSSLSIIHQTILEKKLNFRTLTKIKLVSIGLSVFAGIFLAVKDFGVWALVIMTVSETFIRTVLIWIINKWHPTFVFNVQAFKELYTKGIQIFLAGILKQITQNIYSLVIGKYFTTVDVGFYSQGDKIQKRIGDFINSSIQGVMFPVQSLMKDDVLRLKNAVRKNVKITTLIVFPASVGIIVVAVPFVQLFLTDKWLPSVYYLQILSFASLIYVLRSSVFSFLMPLGKFNVVLGLGTFNSVLLIVLIVIGLIFNCSLKQLVLGKVIQEGIGVLVLMYYSKKHINYSAPEIIVDFLPAALFSVIMGVIVYLEGMKFGISFSILGFQVFTGTSVYVLLNLFFNKKMVKEISQIARSLIKK